MQVLPWDIDSVVSLRGAWSCPVSFRHDGGMQLELMAALLDKGTASHSKRGISEQLERVGASISFSAQGTRIHVSARCLARDLDLVVGLIREQIEEAVLPDREFELLKGRVKAQWHRQQSDPGAVCRNQLSRHLFEETHPSRELPFADLPTVLDGIDIEDLRSLHASEELFGGLRLSVVGDVGSLEPKGLAERLSIRVGGKGRFGLKEEAGLIPPHAATHHVEIPDRSNLNVLFGHSLDVRSNHEDYLALWTGIFILGGNFSSRLMSTVRDEKGLTYGIRSWLGDLGVDHGGSWQTSVTLSQDKLEEGIQATRDVIDDMLRGGVLEAELAERKQTITGSYEVELATTGGTASRLLLNMNRGWEPDRIDTHPGIVRSLEREDVNRALSDHLDPTGLTVISAGTR